MEITLTIIITIIIEMMMMMIMMMVITFFNLIYFAVKWLKRYIILIIGTKTRTLFQITMPNRNSELSTYIIPNNGGA